MSQLLNSVKRDITKVRGKISTALIEPIQQESTEFANRTHYPIPLDLDSITLDFKIVFDEYQKSILSATKAIRTISMTMTGVGVSITCYNCDHEVMHHNPDKRMKSGYGRCICGKCKKYVEWESPWKVPNLTSWISDWPNTNNNIIGSGSYISDLQKNYYNSNLLSYISPETTVSFVVSSRDIIGNNNNIDTIALNFIKGYVKDINRVSITSITTNTEFNGDVTILVTYYEV